MYCRVRRDDSVDALSTAPSHAPVSQAPATSPAPAPPRMTPCPTRRPRSTASNPPTGYTGEFSQIKAVDRLTVEFDMCAPDVSFLSKIAFATNGILDSDWLAAHAKDKSS